MKLTSLLVPLDGSPFGEQALPLALGVARRAGAALELVHVHSPVPSHGPPDLDEQARQAKSAYLGGVANRLADGSGGPVTTTLLIGQPGDALHDHAVAEGADLVVMTTHGRGPLSRFWLGSVADDLMRRLPVPLLLVRPQESVPEESPEPTFRHVLVPLDGSELAEEALEPAVALGGLTQAECTLVRVVDPILDIGDDPDDRRTVLLSRSLYEELAALRRQHLAEAQSYLEEVAGRLRQRSPRVTARAVAALSPATAILHEARDRRADLITLATRGQGGLARLVFGSVADKVVRGATVPVLVHRPRGGGDSAQTLTQAGVAGAGPG
jgi:nucleotide-binding universal stress UspA family protein